MYIFISFYSGILRIVRDGRDRRGPFRAGGEVYPEEGPGVVVVVGSG